MVAVAVDCSGSLAVMIWPSNLVNFPRTLLTIRCRATKPIWEWTGSMSHRADDVTGYLDSLVPP